MFKRIYALAILLLIVGLTSIIGLTIKFTRDANEQSLTEAAHIKQDIVTIAKSTLSEELTDINQDIKSKKLTMMF